MFIGNLIESEMDTISFSEKGLCNINLNFFPFEIELPKIIFLEWEKIDKITSKGKDVIINNKNFASCISNIQAQKYVKILKILKESNKKDRNKIISKYIKNSVNIRKIRKSLKKIKHTNIELQFLSFLHFLFIFCFCPIYNYICPGVFSFIVSVSYAFLLSLLILAYSIFRFRNMRLKYALKWIVMFPFMSIYIRDISKKIPSCYNPYAILLALKSTEEHCAIANRYMRNLRYPTFRIKASNEIKECINYFNVKTIKQFQMELGKEKCNDIFLETKKIVNLAPTTRSYCPKCLNEFIINIAECPDCGCKEIVKVQ